MITDLAFVHKYINPYYGALMNLNFLRTDFFSKAKALALLQEVKDLGEELTEEELLKMLHGTWRPSKVAAWVIALNKWEKYEDELIQFLHKEPNYSEHIIFALAYLNTPRSRQALQDFIRWRIQKFMECIQQKQTYNALDILEKQSIYWSFGALQYLDWQNQTQIWEQSGVSSRAWQDLKTIIENAQVGDLYLSTFRIVTKNHEKASRDEFEQAFHMIEQLS